MDKHEVERIYGLANLDLSNKNIDLIANKFNTILNFIDHIFEVDCNTVEMAEMIDNHIAIFREDKIGESLDRDEALKNAKDTQYGYFRLDWSL